MTHAITGSPGGRAAETNGRDDLSPPCSIRFRDDAREVADALLAQVVREREDYNGKHQSACIEIDRLRKALRSASAQCGNVIYNCEQRPADNQRHLDSWRGVKEFIDAALSVSSTHHSTEAS